MTELPISTDEARNYLKEGGVGVAEMILRQVLAKDPTNATAFRMLGNIARVAGESYWAAEYMRRAGEPVNESEAAIPASSGDKFLLIKAWGNGFCSDLDSVLGHLLLAEMTGRIPVVHWGRNSLFGIDPEKDAFRLYFEPPSSMTIDDLIGKGYDFFPPKWGDANLRKENVNKIAGDWSRLPPLVYFNRPERVAVADVYAGIVSLVPWIRPGHAVFGKSVAEVYRYLIDKYLRPLPDIQSEIDLFAAASFRDRPVIAAHVRGSDKYREDPQLAQKNAVYPQVISQFSVGQWFPRVFLLTDSTIVRDDFQSRYGPGLIMTDSVRTGTVQGVHLQGLPDRRRLGVDVVKDIYLAARCDQFVGLGSSNVTCMVYHMKDWAPESRVIIGPVMTQMLNPYLYMNHNQLERFLPPELMGRLRERERAEREGMKA